jgi:hypothetical protein
MTHTTVQVVAFQTQNRMYNVNAYGKNRFREEVDPCRYHMELEFRTVKQTI